MGPASLGLGSLRVAAERPPSVIELERAATAAPAPPGRLRMSALGVRAALGGKEGGGGRAQLRQLLAGRGLFGRFVYMVATQAVTVLIGLAYWAAAARLISPAQLGIASSGINTATLVATIGIAGISTIMLVKLGSTPEAEQGALISTGVVVAVLIAVPIALGAWLASPMLGPSFRRLGDQPLAGSLFVVGTATQVTALVLDAAAIGMRRGPIQLARNVVAASLKLAFLVVLCLFAARSAVVVLAGWSASSLVSFAAVLPRLGLWGSRDRHGLAQRIEIVRRTWVLSLRHHVLNLAVGSVGYLLPVVAALFLQPSEMAFYTMAAVVSSAGVMVPYLLSMSLFVESTGDEALLRRSMRRTLPLAVAGSVAMIAILEPAAGLVLSVFGHRYAVHGELLLRIILPGSLGYTMKDHFVAARRAQERLGEAAWAGALATTGELVAAGVGGWLGGVYWLVGGWLLATGVELVVFLPSVLAVVRNPRQAGPGPVDTTGERPGTPLGAAGTAPGR